MDVKASARAKHASSQRGRARHSTRKHHPQQQQQQQAGKETVLPQPSPDQTAPPLPSNWSRYEEDDDLPVDDRLSDVPAVKSKGANYRDLLAEKSMFQAPDLASGRKGLMVARGRDIWERLRDVDNIWNISSEEDNFFSLDLDFLSQELAKVDIAERLFVDPKYIPSEEREKSESIYKDSKMTETDDENENETLSSQASRNIPEVSVLTKAPASASSKEVHVFQRSSATVSGESEKEGVSDYRQFEEAATASNSRDRPADSAQSNKLEQFHNKIHRVLKDTLAELPKTTDDRFEAKSAEAELDALLDMLDDKSTGEASNLFPSMFPGYAKSQGSASQRSSYVDVLQENRPLDAFLGSSSKLVVGTPNDSLLDMKGSFEVAIKVDNVPSQAPTVGDVTSVRGSSEEAIKVDNVPYQAAAVGNVSSQAPAIGNVPFQAPAVGNVSSVPYQAPAVGNVSSVHDLDEDFDDWLDSL